MTRIETTDDVIDALGGTYAVMEITSRTYNAVQHWRGNARGRFPAETFLLLKAELERRGLMAPPTLWGLEQPTARPVENRSAEKRGAA